MTEQLMEKPDESRLLTNEEIKSELVGHFIPDVMTAKEVIEVVRNIAAIIRVAQDAKTTLIKDAECQTKIDEIVRWVNNNIVFTNDKYHKEWHAKVKSLGIVEEEVTYPQPLGF